MKSNQIAGILVGLIVVAGIAFFGGMQYQKMSRGNQFMGQNGQFRGAGLAQGNRQMTSRPVNGEIISSDDKSITVKLQDGSTKIILLNDQSTISEATSSSKQSLTTGKKVVVFGNTNQDGSVTAQNIQLNPQGGMMFGQRGQ